jgi:hypothetical protein
MVRIVFDFPLGAGKQNNLPTFDADSLALSPDAPARRLD